MVNASVCKTDMRGFESHPGLIHYITKQVHRVRHVIKTPVIDYNDKKLTL